MLLEDVFASNRPHRVHTKNLPKSAVHFSYNLKSNKIIGQWKTTNIDKQFYQRCEPFMNKMPVK